MPAKAHPSTIRRSLLVLLVSALAACNGGQGDHLGSRRYKNCVPCHGEAGGGSRAIGAPAIAGLPGWYVEAQLRKFRDGVRGAHPDDEEGLRMRPMARMLIGEEEVRAVAAHVAGLERVAQPRSVTGDAARGKGLFLPCIACHGESGRGRQEMGTADLHVPGDWYLVAQLKKFKSGVRGAARGDATGAQMRPMAATLMDEQAMRDVVAYISTLARQ